MLAAGALVAARALARATSRYRLYAAGFVMVALTGPAALAVGSLRPAGAGTGSAASALEPFAVPILVAVGAFAAALLVELCVDVVRLRRIKRAATPLGPAGVRNALIGLSATVQTPTAIGYLHPAIVVPDDFRTRVDAAEWDAVVAHERAHLARRDDWAKAVQSAAVRAGWWLPGLWVLSRRLDLERELASDERAVAATGARRYAACLLRLATTGCRDALAPGLWGRRSHVAIRVERLLRPTPGSSPLLRAAALGAFTAVAIAVAGTVFAVVPSVGRHATLASRRPVADPAESTAAAGAERVAYLGAAEKTAAREPAAVRIAAPAPAAVATMPRPPAVASPPARAADRPVHTVLVVKPRPPAPPRTVALSPAVRSAALAALQGTVGSYLPRFRCATCFHPLHDPEGAQPVAAAAAGATPAPVIAVSEDTGSGPATGRTGFFTLRLPRALTLP